MPLYFKCDKCGRIYETSKTLQFDFCPACGIALFRTEKPNDVNVEEINLFDKCTLYTNCTIEIWENSLTGQQSIGWHRTPKTEVIEEDE